MKNGVKFSIITQCQKRVISVENLTFSKSDGIWFLTVAIIYSYSLADMISSSTCLLAPSYLFSAKNVFSSFNKYIFKILLDYIIHTIRPCRTGIFMHQPKWVH